MENTASTSTETENIQNSNNINSITTKNSNCNDNTIIPPSTYPLLFK